MPLYSFPIETETALKYHSYLNIVDNLWSESIKWQEKLKQNVNTRKGALPNKPSALLFSKMRIGCVML